MLVNLRIQSEYRKIQTRKNSVFGRFSRSDKYIWNDQRENSNVFGSKGDQWGLRLKTSLSIWILFGCCLTKL